MTHGRKFDNGKNKWDLLPFCQIEKIVEVLTYGADKYDKNNWQHVENGEERYFAAAMRHLVAHRKGQMFDQETDSTHLAHAACNILFMMWLQENKKEFALPNEEKIKD
jgi:hypothetical protein